jgi:hypothetical protein
MSEIKKYQKAMNFKANPRYLTRDFIVPLYTGTEPDILDDSNTQRESGTYTPFPNDMPIVSPKEIQNQPYEQLQLADGGSVERQGFELGGDVQDWVKENYPGVKLDFKKHPKMGLGTLDKDYSMIRSAITKKLKDPNYVKPSLDIYINKIADAFLKADAKDDISYLASKNKFNKNGLLSNAEISFLSRKINSPTFVQDIVDKTGLKAEQILDMLDERENFIELDLIPEMATRNKQLGSQEINKRISQGEDWLIKNSKNYNSVKDLKKGFTRVLGKDHPFLKQTLKTSYGMPKLNPLFFEEKEKIYQTRGNRTFMYGEPDMKNLFEASLYNFNPTVRDKVLNELNNILPKTKITENQKFDSRKKFQDSKILSELGINKGLKGPVTRLLIKDLGDNIIEDINFIRYPRTEVGNYINYLKDKVDPKYRKQFNLVNDALNDIKKNNYNGAKQKLNIVENINFDHRVPKYLIDAGYADELEYIKLNPVGEKFNQVVKNKNFDRPMARLSRQYEATDIPEDKAKIVEKMNDLKDNFNKRYNNYLSDINIKEVDGKLNFSSSLKPVTSADELIKNLNTNVKDNPQFFKITAGDKRKIIQEIGNFGCGVQNKAMGGRITFSEGSDCFNKGLKMLEEGKINIQQLKSIEGAAGEGENAAKIIKNLYTFGKEGGKLAGKGLGEIISIGSGPVGLVAGAALETAFAAPYLLEGDYKQALRQSIFGQVPEFLGVDIGSRDEDIIKLAKDAGVDPNSVKKYVDLKKNYIENEEYGQKLNMLDEMYKRDPKNLDYVQQIRRLENKIKPSSDYLEKNIYSPKDLSKYEEDYFKAAKYFVDKNAERALLTRSEEQKKSSLKDIVEESSSAIREPEDVQNILKRKNLLPQEPETQPQEELPDYYKVSAADGGRIGLKEGGGPKMGRRGFLGLLGAIAATPLVKGLMKGEKATLKGTKVAAKVLPKVAGMPEWFPSLIAKIEKEGIDISPKATRVEDIRTIKKIEVPVPGKKEPEIITMTQYPNGAIHIEANVYGGAFEAPFDLHYKPPKTDIDLETGKTINEPGEFSVMETRPRPAYEPGEWELEYESMSVKDAISDLEKVEKIATGKRIHPKRVEQRAGARKFIEENPYEDIVNRYPDPDVPDWWEYDK